MSDETEWSGLTWQGNRDELLQRGLRMSVRERFEQLGRLSEAADALAAAGRGSPDERPEIGLRGCRPTPLASYLKALGVLRLVGEQADVEARGWWTDEGFRIATTLTRDELLRFFLERYRPTPILAPWNGGSGFHPKDNQSGIGAVERSGADRFSPVRQTIVEIREILSDFDVADGMRPEIKELLLARLRSELNEEALVWFDAAVLLTEDAPRYPPLLGTGGNDGRLDFTNNFLQRLVELFDPATGAPRSEAESLLRGALFGDPIPRLWGAAMGQYAPADTGGANASTGFFGGTLMNPWDFLLMLEGALLFAGSAARRLESGSTARLAYPFTVRPTGAGSGGTAAGDEGGSRGESWMPLWKSPASLTEVRTVLAEGRAVLNGVPVRDGLDFVRAVSKLGVDRGLSEFVRYGFLMRNGKAFLATPLGRVKVRPNPESELIDELDQHGWLSAFKSVSSARGKAPARLVSLGRRLQDALFRMAKGEGGRRVAATRIQEVLIILGEIQRYHAASQKGREALNPVPQLSRRWAVEGNDGSDEYLIAAALAGLGAEKRQVGAEGANTDLFRARGFDVDRVEGADNRTGSQEDPRRMGMRMAAHLAPVSGDRWVSGWVEGEREVVWTEGDLIASLVAVLERRLVKAEMEGRWEKPLSGSYHAPLSAVGAWLSGGPNFDARIGRLLPGLALARIPRSLEALTQDRSERAGSEAPASHVREANLERWSTAGDLPIAYAMLKPLFVPGRQLGEAGLLDPGTSNSASLELSLALVRALAAERVAAPIRSNAILEEAYRRLRLARLNPPRGPDRSTGELPGLSPALAGATSLGVDGRRLLAALMVPVAARDLRALADRLFVRDGRS